VRTTRNPECRLIIRQTPFRLNDQPGSPDISQSGVASLSSSPRPETDLRSRLLVGLIPLSGCSLLAHFERSEHVW
jgi:hypothetical protein